MKIQNNINNQIFKGYSNVIYHDSGKGPQRCLFIAAQLNNKDGHNDLDEYRAFKKAYDMPQRKIDDDVIVMFYNKISPQEDNIFLGDEPLFWGEELDKLSANLPEDLTKESYKAGERNNMKGYTLMASLTRRMAESNELPPHEPQSRLLSTCRSVLFALTDDFYAAKSYINDVVENTKVKKASGLKQAASEFNSIIQETMKAFIK